MSVYTELLCYTHGADSAVFYVARTIKCDWQGESICGILSEHFGECLRVFLAGCMIAIHEYGVIFGSSGGFVLDCLEWIGNAVGEQAMESRPVRVSF